MLSFPLTDNVVLNDYLSPPYARGIVRNADEIRRRADECIAEFDIRTPSADVPAGTLSGGNQQKVVVAREFGRDLKLLVLDQPTRGLDVGSVEFIHSAADQEYYQLKGFASDPKRCSSCRASRRATRDGGYDVRDIGGPRGYERGDDRPDREYFAVVCSSCGNQAQVPFKPRMDRPVYCSDCFRQVRPD